MTLKASCFSAVTQETQGFHSDRLSHPNFRLVGPQFKVKSLVKVLVFV